MPLDQVDWFINKQPEVVELEEAAQAAHQGHKIPDAEYFVYGRWQKSTSVRPEYFRNLLLISSRGEDNIMDVALNPRVVSEDGEWEAWKLSSHYPGAMRFKSFARLMEWLYVCEMASFGYFVQMSRTSISR